MTSTRCWWSPGKQCRRSSVRPAVTQRGTRDWSKNSRLTMGLKFRSDKNISKWPPKAVALPILAGKCPPFVRRRAVRRRCCASDPWRTPSSIRSNLVFRRDTCTAPRGFPFGRLNWWPRLVGDRYVISSAGVTPNEVSGKIHKDTRANPTSGRLNCFEALAAPPKMPYVLLIEFRPNDLALPRIARLTDDILPKSRMSRLR